MVYTDTDGYTASDYIENLDDEMFPIITHPDWINFKKYWRARIRSDTFEYKFVWTDTQPTSGNYLKVLWKEQLDKIADVAGQVQKIMKLLNRAITLPSGTTIFSGEGTIIDYDIPEDPYQGKMLYMIGFYYRHLGETDWVQGTIRKIDWINMCDIDRAVDTGSELIWNVQPFNTVVSPPPSSSNRMWCFRKLGPHIYNDFPSHSGIAGTKDWRFKTDEDPPRYLLGTDEYWTTHGYPDGRTYSIWVDGFKHDIPLAVIVLLSFKLFKKLGIGAKMTNTIMKLMTSIFNMNGYDFSDDQIDEIIENISVVDENVDYVTDKLKKAYSPQRGSLRF